MVGMWGVQAQTVATDSVGEQGVQESGVQDREVQESGLQDRGMQERELQEIVVTAPETMKIGNKTVSRLTGGWWKFPIRVFSFLRGFRFLT